MFYLSNFHGLDSLSRVSLIVLANNHAVAGPETMNKNEKHDISVLVMYVGVRELLCRGAGGGGRHERVGRTNNWAVL